METTPEWLLLCNSQSLYTGITYTAEQASPDLACWCQKTVGKKELPAWPTGGVGGRSAGSSTYRWEVRLDIAVLKGPEKGERAEGRGYKDGVLQLVFQGTLENCQKW